MHETLMRREAVFDTNYKTCKFLGEKLFPSVWQRVIEILDNNSTFFSGKMTRGTEIKALWKILKMV